ncbi:SDR family oxidoreductase [Mucilaginibacter panaciglaebae]|uniref:SDR family oxidoreductase n=1 Tax=Mucilaginibacter panaciglaebae TaxID=502331 RepID=A0ABP7WA25_9SPHI
MNRIDFTGKSIIVTGASTGIGRAITYQMAAAGAWVLAVGHDSDHLNETLQNADTAFKDRLGGVLADLSNEDGINRVFEEADSKFGKIDILVNNAALGAGAVMDGDYSELNKVIQTNLTAYLACAQAAVSRMQDAQSGHIINIGSMSAHTKEKNSSIYVATKSAIRGFSESLRKEVNELGIKVTLIEPGAVDTEMQEASQEEKNQQKERLEMLEADDIAAAVIYAVEQPLRCDVVAIQLRPHLQVI